jgi:hypothetical protein
MLANGLNSIIEIGLLIKSNTMKPIKLFVVLISCAVLMLAGCKKPAPTSTQSLIDKDTLSYDLIADTITYDVVIKNTVSVDPVSDKFLRYLDKTTLIDDIFKSIYAGKLTAYNYDTKNKLSLTEIKVMEGEEGYSREYIGKIQFAEVWLYNVDHSVFKKKVLSMVLGYEQFNDDGTLRGYKPMFKVYLN